MENISKLLFLSSLLYSDKLRLEPFEHEPSAQTLVTCVPSHERAPRTMEAMVDDGIPVQNDKFRWDADSLKDLSTAIQQIRQNKEDPPRPPGKPILKWMKENVFLGCSPSEDQIRRKLLSMKCFH